MALSEQERAVIDYERSWWKEPGPKETEIRSRLRMSPSRYYRLLTALIDSPEAYAYDPLVILRLRQTRHRRRRARFEGRSVDGPRAR